MPLSLHSQSLRTLAILSLFLSLQSASQAAIGCTLSNPGRDLKALYPTMTSYREELREIRTLPDGIAAYTWLRERVGSDLDPVYEGPDTPYTLYAVFEQERLIGYVHGVNVPGRGGVIQVFLAIDPETSSIVRMFFQRLESPGGAALRNPAVRNQFVGLTLADFYRHDYFSVADPNHPADRVGRLVPPASLPEAAQADWQATLRGVRKNLVLLDLFVFERRHDPFFARSRDLLTQQEKKP